MQSSDRVTFVERARRSQIIEAAVDVVVGEGFGRASLTRIAEHAGTSKGVVLYHFGSKDALVRAVVDTIYTQVGEGMRREVAEPERHLDRLAAYVRGNLAFIATDHRRVLALQEIFTSFRREDGRLAYDESSMSSVLEPLEVLLREGQRAGELADFDPSVMARTIRAAIDAVIPQLAHNPHLDMPRYGEELIRLFTRAAAHEAEETS